MAPTALQTNFFKDNRYGTWNSRAFDIIKAYYIIASCNIRETQNNFNKNYYLN